MAGAIVGVVGEEAPLVIVDGAAEFEVNRGGCHSAVVRGG